MNFEHPMLQVAYNTKTRFPHRKELVAVVALLAISGLFGFSARQVSSTMEDDASGGSTSLAYLTVSFDGMAVLCALLALRGVFFILTSQRQQAVPPRSQKPLTPQQANMLGVLSPGQPGRPVGSGDLRQRLSQKPPRPSSSPALTPGSHSKQNERADDARQLHSPFPTTPFASKSTFYRTPASSRASETTPQRSAASQTPSSLNRSVPGQWTSPVSAGVQQRGRSMSPTLSPVGSSPAIRKGRISDEHQLQQFISEEIAPAVDDSDMFNTYGQLNTNGNYDDLPSPFLMAQLGMASGLNSDAILGSYRGYQPSPTPQASKASVLAAESDKPPTSEITLLALRELGVESEDLELYAERMRQWLVAKVLRPLIEVVDRADKRVELALERINFQLPGPLPPLRKIPSSANVSKSSKGIYSLNPLNLFSSKQDSSTDLSPAEQAAEAAVVERAFQLEQYLASNQLQMREEVGYCLDALRARAQLARILTGAHAQSLQQAHLTVFGGGAVAGRASGMQNAGERSGVGVAGSGLMPQCPAAYAYERVRQLASDACMVSYQWDSGGSWSQGPWASHLPTDSELVLHLFSAWVHTRAWTFPPIQQVSPYGSVSGRPFYGGTLPTVANPVDRFFAVTCQQLPKGNQSCALLVLRASTEPRVRFYNVVDEGKPIVAFQGRRCLQALTMFLRTIHKEHKGNCGPVHLSRFGLGSVFESF